MGKQRNEAGQFVDGHGPIGKRRRGVRQVRRGLQNALFTAFDETGADDEAHAIEVVRRLRTENPVAFLQLVSAACGMGAVAVDSLELVTR